MDLVNHFEKSFILKCLCIHAQSCTALGAPGLGKRPSVVNAQLSLSSRETGHVKRGLGPLCRKKSMCCS